jgi:putative Ca2+/H+ antiporter (TMEM165/GDT1 family)
MVSVGVIATVFVFIAIAEIPDKTMIATLIMGSRSRPIYVWLGATAAFAVHVTLAVVAGRLLELLPHRALEAVVTALFLAGAAFLLFVPEREEEERGEGEAPTEVSTAPLRVMGTAFGVILIGEFGDLTQLLTVNFVAKYHQPISVFIGALAALMTVSALGAFGGRALLRVLPVAIIRRIGGIVLVGFAAYNIYSLATS